MCRVNWFLGTEYDFFEDYVIMSQKSDTSNCNDEATLDLIVI